MIGVVCSLVEMQQDKQCSGVFINDTVFLTQYNEIDKDYSGGKVWQVYDNVIGRVWVKQHSFLLLYTIEPKSPDLQPTLAVENEKQVEEEDRGVLYTGEQENILQ